jgi:hypothetical protein
MSIEADGWETVYVTEAEARPAEDATACLCGHGPKDHCDDGECIHGGVVPGGYTFACGCTRWRTVETEAARARFRQESIDWYRAKGDAELARILERGPPS